MNAPSSIPSGSKFAQMKVDQTPRYGMRRKMFRKQLRRGRPRKNMTRQHWIR